MSKDGFFVSEEYVQELVDEISRRTVGKIMKRYDILEVESLVRNLTKEHVYEGFREIKTLLLAYRQGFEISVFKFNQGDHPTQTKE